MLDLPSGLARRVGLLGLSVFFIGAGAAHFVKPEFYVSIMPTYMPYPLALVYVSGFFEVLGGLGVIVPATRRWAGYGLVALLLAVSPVHVEMALRPESYADFGPPWAIYLRLPVQLLFIAWAWWATAPEE